VTVDEYRTLEAEMRSRRAALYDRLASATTDAERSELVEALRAAELETCVHGRSLSGTCAECDSCCGECAKGFPCECEDAL
jgi:hypothetical protein